MDDVPRLEWPVPAAPFALSARRFFEHVRLRQINPFALQGADVTTLAQADAVIDLLAGDDAESELTGLTLAELGDLTSSVAALGRHWPAVRRGIRAGAADEARAFVLQLAREGAARRATRNPPAPFLPRASDSDVFGVRHLRSRLCDYLEQNAGQRQRPVQWLGTLANLATRGLRQEELQRSGLRPWLESRDPAELIRGADLRAAVDFSALRLSILPNTGETRAQLRLKLSGPRDLPPARGIETRQIGQRRRLRYFDPVFGYRIEAVERDSLWGTDRYWQALTYRGTVLPGPVAGRSICDSAKSAVARAAAHAHEHFPKLHAAGAWGDYAWSGGEDYREWLITLPIHRWTYLSSHFPVRNVLAHVRCDVREGAGGERVLLLQELQSDWMQEMRRAPTDQTDPELEALATPWMRDWPALTLKLMCLHAAHTGCDALAWLRGGHQVDRYDGRGRDGLANLYDRELPRLADRMIRPFGLVRGEIDVFVPRNFSIRAREDRYEVLDIEGHVLGSAGTFQQARKLVPDGAHEELQSVHAVRLSAADRGRVLEAGMFAWS